MPAELDKLHKGILQALKKQFPKVKDSELEQRAWAIATKKYQDMTKGESLSSGDSNTMTNFKEEAQKAEQKIQETMTTDKKEVKRDEKGRIIVAENVPVIFNTYMYSE